MHKIELSEVKEKEEFRSDSGEISFFFFFSEQEELLFSLLTEFILYHNTAEELNSVTEVKKNQTLDTRDRTRKNEKNFFVLAVINRIRIL